MFEKILRFFKKSPQWTNFGDRSVPLTDRIIRYLCYYGRGDASSISVHLIESHEEIQHELTNLFAKGKIMHCEEQIDNSWPAYELKW